jgi:predicted acyl esterase
LEIAMQTRPNTPAHGLSVSRRSLLAGGSGLAASLALNGTAAATARAVGEAYPRMGTLRIYGDDAYPVPYRRALPLDAPRARYTGFKPGVTILKAGTVRREGALPLPCDIVFERDVPLKMRDGTTIYTDVFRPVGGGKHPAIIAWSPYGKEIGGQWLDDIQGRSGVPLAWVSELQKFEGPDPAFWVNNGYVVLNPDPRGAYASEGDITYWGRQLAEDGYDFIEWGAKQPWSNGKLGLSGNSYLAVSQWFIAAERPPHLAAIAPWEGFADHFRDVGNRGGIPAPAFSEAIINTFAGKRGIEDQPKMIAEQQLLTPYWEDKKARLDRIHVPAYVVASFNNPAHTHGSFDGFRNIGSKEKWLRINNTNEWLDYYTPQYAQELLAFFDHYLKGADNGWEKTPKVRICVLDPSGTDEVDRVESDWPLLRTKFQKLFVTDGGGLAARAQAKTGQSRYDVSAPGKAEFRHTFDRDTEITGYMSLRLWVEAVGSNDMELAVTVEKRAGDGKPFHRELGEGAHGAVSATGFLRVSHRELDKARSTPSEPYLMHKREQLLNPGQTVPVDISIWPMGMRYKAGEQLVLTVSANTPMTTQFDMAFGAASIPVPVDGATFAPNTKPSLVTLGGPPPSSPSWANAQRVPTPISRNKGVHVIRFGGKYDSHLLIPVIPA